MAKDKEKIVKIHIPPKPKFIKINFIFEKV